MLHIITCYDQYDAGKMLLGRMVQDSVRNPAGSYIALVPEQATLRMQQAVIAAHPQHAVMNIDVISFERLAHSVFQELGVLSRTILNDTGKVLVLRRVLQECRDSLKIYRGKTRMPGFAEQIKSAVSEFKQYSLDDNQLFLMQESAQREQNKILYEKLQDIRLIYRRFNEAIADKYTTQEEVPDALARLASRSAIVTGSRFYLDGFTGFTPVQYRLIGEFLRCSIDVTVTVIIPKDAIETNDMDMFSLSRTTFRKLQELAAKQNVPCKILHMPGVMEDADTRPLPRAAVFSAADKDREIRRIAAQILDGVQRGKRRFRDYGVVLADMEAYHKTVEEVFAQANIPCFIDHKKKLSDNLLARFLGAALQVVQERCSYDSVFSLLKTRMSSLTPRQIYELENYCLAFGIREYSVWKKDFTRNKVRKGAISGENKGELWDLESINESRKAVAALLSGFYEACMKKDRTAADYTAALKTLLENAGIRDRIAEFADRFKAEGDVSRGKEYEQVYQQMVTLLDQIADLMGNEVLSVWEFREILTGAFAQIQVSIIPPSLDAVPVGDLVRSRMGQPEILFLAGANDGTIPQKTAGSGLFTAQERTFLKQENFELAPDGLEDLYTQQFYLYLLFTRAKNTLFVSWARMSPEGEELRPSYIVEHMEEIVPGLSAEMEAAPDASGLWLEQGKQKLTRALSRYCGGEQAKEARTLTMQEQALLHYAAQAHRPWLEQILSAAFFSNRVLPLDEQIVKKLYGNELSGSVSRYESFYECPFRHFLDYGLRLKEREEFQVQSSELGTVYHESLERYAGKLSAEGLTFRTVSDEDSDRIAQEAVAEAASEMTGDILRSSERNRYLLGRMVQITRKTADVLRDQVQQGAYDPAYFELAFEDKTSGDAALRGKIDRVDLYEDGDIFVKIIDYKSGKKAFSVKDIYSGLQLQLTAYLSCAARQLENDYPGKRIRPGGIYYYLIQDKFIKSSEDTEEKYCMSGLTNSDPQAVRAIDRNLGPGQASTIVPVEYGKTGALSSRSVVASDEEFWHLMGFVQGKIREAAQQIRQGEASIRPYCGDADKNACRFCSYHGVCKFEPGKWGSDERTLPEGLDKKDLEKEIYGRN